MVFGNTQGETATVVSGPSKYGFLFIGDQSTGGYSIYAISNTQPNLISKKYNENDERYSVNTTNYSLTITKNGATSSYKSLTYIWIECK